ncbi:MAG: protein kinase [Gammaproteobacteria bacterium]|nr:protein kinase [Gammaproteobacteria bacterium]
MSEPVKLLIIESGEDWRAWLRRHVEVVWHAAQFTELSPEQAARLPGEFGGADFDVVVLTLEANRALGLTWLREYAGRRGFPPVIAVGVEGDEALAVQAMRAGAQNYLPRERLRHDGLIAALREALAERRTRGAQPEAAGGAAVPVMKGWRLVRELHASALSRVSLACSEETGEQRVFKSFNMAGADVATGVLFDRFLREYQSIAGVDHANVVRIFDLGVADDHAWIAMEYLAGGTLASRISRGRLTPGEALTAVRELARGLAAVHAVGILHRDLKPANVMLREDGSLVLIDFGLAREMQGRAGMTSPGMIFGTPWYMSPEQGHGGAVDERSDCYSLGVMFYEMLTGSRPFSAPTPMALIYQHRNALRPQLPAELADFEPLVHRMMAANPADRFESVRHVLAALGE